MKNVTTALWFAPPRRMTIAKWIAALAFGALCVSPLSVLAGPGAHGPDGQHLDAPAAGAGAVGAAPRVEAKTEIFELVGTLKGGEFSVLIDRFASNAPVLNAKVEVEFGPIKAVAKFQADVGDYTVDDAAFLKAISKPGAHPLVFTLVVGDESDLLDGTLTISAALEDQSHSHGQTYFGMSRWVAIGAGAVAFVLLIVGGLFFRSRMKRNASRPYAGSR
jgi:hypothetical protein